MNGFQGTPQTYKVPSQYRAGLFSDAPETFTQIQTKSNPQLAAQRGLLNQAQQGLQGLNLDFAPIAEKRFRQHHQQYLPGLAEQFTGRGLGGQRGTPFAAALGQGGRALSNDLAALESGYNLQKGGFLHDLLRTGLSPEFETFHNEAQPSYAAQFAGAAAPGASKFATNAASNAFDKYFLQGTSSGEGQNQQNPQQQPQDQSGWVNWFKSQDPKDVIALAAKLAMFLI